MTRQQKHVTTAQPISASEELAIYWCARINGDPAIDPRFYRGPYFQNVAEYGPCSPANRWTPESRAAYEAKIAWFHKARYGICFCFTTNLVETPVEARTSGWTSEKWNAWIDAIDVDKLADQAKEVGAGYVVTCIAQVGQYYCAPNPVLEKYWGLKPGQFGSKRDLPMDLSRALAKRGIRMMLYTHAEGLYGLPLPPGMDKATAYRRWLGVMQWDSDHYGKAVSGWWTDCLAKEVFDEKKSAWVPNYVEDFLAALRHGNPDALVNGPYDIADFMHGHCGGSWAEQQKTLPYFGRWDPEFKIQWHAFQYLGPNWGQPGVAHTTPDMVRYVEKIAEGGGVITFDLGAHDGKGNGPLLEIAADQMAQLCAIRDALKEVPLTDGTGMRQKTLERLLMKVKPECIQLHAAWPLHMSDTFALNAPDGIQIRGKVQDGVLVELEVTPADRRQDIKLIKLRPYPYPLTADGWKVSRLMPPGNILAAAYLGLDQDGGWEEVWTAAPSGAFFISVNDMRSPDGIVYLARKVHVAEAGDWILHVGHDGGARVFVDGEAIGGEAGEVNPAPPIRTSAPVTLAAGEHEIVVALDRAGGKGWGIFVSFEVPEGCDYSERTTPFPEPVSEV